MTSILNYQLTPATQGDSPTLMAKMAVLENTVLEYFGPNMCCKSCLQEGTMRSKGQAGAGLTRLYLVCTGKTEQGVACKKTVALHLAALDALPRTIAREAKEEEKPLGGGGEELLRKLNELHLERKPPSAKRSPKSAMSTPIAGNMGGGKSQFGTFNFFTPTTTGGALSLSDIRRSPMEQSGKGPSPPAMKLGRKRGANMISPQTGEVEKKSRIEEPAHEEIMEEFRCQNANWCSSDYTDKCGNCDVELCDHHLANHKCGRAAGESSSGEADYFCEWGGCLSEGENQCDECDKIMCGKHTTCHRHEEEEIEGGEEVEILDPTQLVTENEIPALEPLPTTVSAGELGEGTGGSTGGEGEMEVEGLPHQVPPPVDEIMRAAGKAPEGDTKLDKMLMLLTSMAETSNHLLERIQTLEGHWKMAPPADRKLKKTKRAKEKMAPTAKEIKEVPKLVLEGKSASDQYVARRVAVKASKEDKMGNMKERNAKIVTSSFVARDIGYIAAASMIGGSTVEVIIPREDLADFTSKVEARADLMMIENVDIKQATPWDKPHTKRREEPTEHEHLIVKRLVAFITGKSEGIRRAILEGHPRERVDAILTLAKEKGDSKYNHG